MIEAHLFVPMPEYYMGFVIQRHPDGYFPYKQNDTANPSSLRFSTMGRAMAWIEKQAKRELER